MPNWGGDLSHIDFQNIYYYAKAAENQSKSWDDILDSVRNTFEKASEYQRLKENFLPVLDFNTSLK